MEWTREKTLALINEYRKRRGLWDMTSDDYRKKDMKQKLMAEVSDSLGGGIPLNEIEKKFHTLRTQYHREINRMKRKEPYNSKWFGFKNLDFLSSPKACRANKGRAKSEINEEGNVTTQYILRDVSTSQNQTNADTSISDSTEFLPITRKTTNAAVVSYEEAALAATSRSHELEKLIEETTKDVEEDMSEIEIKPKVTIKQIGVHLASTSLYQTGAELAENEHHVNQSEQQMQADEAQMETQVEIQAADEEISFQTQSSTTHHVHTHPIPTRIIKVQRRDTSHEDYHFQHHHPEEHQTINPQVQTKRIYYETNGQQHAILTSPIPTPTQSNANSTVNVNNQNNSSIRDEYSTYGECVANEMRNITSREILIELKHKINTALFDASMADLRK